MMGQVLLSVKDLKIHFHVAKEFGRKTEYVKAVDGVSFDVRKGEVFGIVGESGCGKSTLSRGICKLVNPTGGTIVFDGEEITGYSSKAMRPVRRKMQLVFQDPYSSLNPRMSVFDIVAEPLIEHKLARKKSELNAKVLELLQRVGSSD